MSDFRFSSSISFFLLSLFGFSFLSLFSLAPRHTPATLPSISLFFIHTYVLDAHNTDSYSLSFRYHNQPTHIFIFDSLTRKPLSSHTFCLASARAPLLPIDSAPSRLLRFSLGRKGRVIINARQKDVALLRNALHNPRTVRVHTLALQKRPKLVAMLHARHGMLPVVRSLEHQVLA